MPKPSIKPHLLKLLQDFLSKHPGKPVNLSNFAQELDVTKQYIFLLYRQLEKEYNLPPIDNSKRGFGSMDKQRLKLITTQASRKAHALGKAHKFTTEEARIAGRKGGLKPKSKNLKYKIII